MPETSNENFIDYFMTAAKHGGKKPNRPGKAQCRI
jgi:hypothetical protein